MSTQEKYAITVSKKNYLLFKMVAGEFEKQGYNSQAAEDVAMQALLESNEAFYTLFYKIKQILEVTKGPKPTGPARFG